MASFKEVKDLLLLEHSNGLISDDELLFFMGEYQSKNPESTYDIYERFNLDDMEEPECKAYFRFEKNDIPVLAETLGLPDFFKCTQRTVAGKIEGLCLVLRRMAYPCRLGDLIPKNNFELEKSFSRKSMEVLTSSRREVDKLNFFEAKDH
ncbi:predicted protein, partial [Nematostella vectensis]